MAIFNSYVSLPEGRWLSHPEIWRFPVMIIQNHPFLMGCSSYYQWEFQDPKMEVLYHIRPYFMGIFPYIGLTK